MEEVIEMRQAASKKAVEMLAPGMFPESLFKKLAELTEKGDAPATIEFADRVEDAVLSSPFVDHMGIFKQLDLMYDCIIKERKVALKLVYRKFKALEEDKKTDPLVLEEARKQRDAVDRECASLHVKMTRVKLVIGPPEEGVAAQG
mmetsp:Transcript_1654/g.3500  ORF Transcript_1654/g.3500 Transcript_1654/m.3500 type:complete len:146 (+) Transcript_1654:138-575(+)|eukprot:CAMPEP_0172623622 /NCGR_PEP_ID=MMETSP1068-20121228/130416_1 /TAXON_ID=35684 /ORGANISM="Pseudopedinella elastica, Strain CCMP716" /LENGTH=145 /DNA_ID=CAMNT_0013432265 /DNA_START=45 /DNA_END=482 /DNA_ORIENTATION=-